METIKGFCSESGVPAAVVRAVVRQVGGWDSFREMAQDVANHGADGGFSGFIYHADTVKFAKANFESIYELASGMAQECGYDSVVTMVAGFRCLKDWDRAEIERALYLKNKGEAETAVYNALAWFALEEVSRSYADMVTA
jgi:hypothetical protein